jgi:hypothetical protein
MLLDIDSPLFLCWVCWNVRVPVVRLNCTFTLYFEVHYVTGTTLTWYLAARVFLRPKRRPLFVFERAHSKEWVIAKGTLPIYRHISMFLLCMVVREGVGGQAGSVGKYA